MARKKVKAVTTKFKRGHVPYNKGKAHVNNDEIAKDTHWVRLPRDMYDDASQWSPDGSVLQLGDAYGQPSSHRLLRPSKGIKTITDDHVECLNPEIADLSTYRLLHMLKTQQLWIEAMEEHFPPPECQGRLIWDIRGEVKRGLCWRERLKCTCGNYTSKRHNLYNTVDIPNQTGPKIASANVGVNIGLMNTMSGTTALRNVLLAANIPAPSVSGMQKRSNKVADMITNLNKEDMAKQRRHIRDINETRGLERSAPIRSEGDGRYNNPLGSGRGHTPFQPATQATYTLIENVTKKKKIIGLHVANKLCSKHSRDQKPHADHDCTANIPMEQSIGDEELWAKEAYTSMQGDEDGEIPIAYFTSDGDSKAVKGIASAQRGELVNLRDTQHLSLSVYKAVCKANFSATMLPSGNQQLRDRLKRELGHNIRRRMHGEFNAAFTKFNGDVPTIINHLSHCADALIQCYGGKCGNMCHKFSMLCKGTKSRKWEHEYMQFMPGNKGRQNLEMTKADEDLLRGIIAMRFSPAAIQMTRFNTNTQKSESVNRVFTRTNPKQVTFKRNFPGRVHSAVHLSNHGIGESTILKCQQAGAPIIKGSKVAHMLRSEQASEKSRSSYHSSVKAKSQRRQARRNQYAHYSRKCEQETYRKNMLDNARLTFNKDHAYATRSRARPTLADHQYSKQQIK